MKAGFCIVKTRALVLGIAAVFILIASTVVPEEGILERSIRDLEKQLAELRTRYTLEPQAFGSDRYLFLLSQELFLADLQDKLLRLEEPMSSEFHQSLRSRKLSLKLQIIGSNAKIRNRIFTMVPRECISSTQYDCVRSFIESLSSTLFVP